MSVIFQTLKKLQYDRASKDPKNKRSRKGLKIYSFRNLLSSSLVVFFICAILFVSGYLAITGIRQLKERQEAEKSIPVALQNEKAAQTDTKSPSDADVSTVKTENDGGSVTVPPPPDMKKIAAEMDEKGLPGSVKKISPSPASANKARYLPPESPSKKGPADPTRRAAAPVNKSLTQTTKKAPTPERGVQKKSPREDHTPALKPSRMPDQRTSEPPADVSFDVSSSAPVSEEDFATARPPEKKPDTLAAGQQTEAPQGGVQVESIDTGQEISGLVADIQTLTVLKEFESAEARIDQLALLKGGDHHLVLNLKAYVCILKEDYESAAGFLDQIFYTHADALDAGINMAIVEIRTNQLKAAKDRLLRLKSLYPENTFISELLLQLR